MQSTEKIRIPSTVRVVAIQNYGASGSLFLQSLLDGHPNLLSLPALYIRSYYTFWERHGGKAPAAIVEAFMREHDYWFRPEGADKGNGLHQLGENQAESASIDRERFLSALKDLLERQSFSRKTLFQSIYLAYADVLGGGIPETVYLVFPIHSAPPSVAECLVEDYPDALFLHTVREPIQLIGSMMKHILFHRLPVNAAECAFSQIIADYSQHWGNGSYVHGPVPYFPENAANARAVRLEDLHSRPKETLEAVCRWLCVPWDDRLLTSTFNRKKWWNRPESPRISGFGGAVLTQKHEQWFTAFDKARLHAVLASRCRLWGYPVPAWTDSPALEIAAAPLLALPFKAELISCAPRLINLARGAPMLLWDAVKAAHRLLDAAGLPVPDLEEGRRLKARIFDRLGRDRRVKAAAVLLIPAAVPVALAAVPIIILRDYLMVRFWLWRGWAANRRAEKPEVRLLPIAGAAR